MRAKIPMDGLSRTGGMVAVRRCTPSGSSGGFQDFVRLLAERRINMHLFLGTLLDDGDITSCVAEADGNRLKNPTDSIPDCEAEIQVSGPVGLISIFPHRSSLKAVGSAFLALAGAHIPLGGFCSSLSTLTFIIDQAHQEKALAVLAECFEIPPARIYSREPASSR